jgi:hypothetical protein
MEDFKMNQDDLDAIKQYIDIRAKNGYSDEELFEMQASFGPDEEVVDIFTGQTINLHRKNMVDALVDMNKFEMIFIGDKK